MNGIINLHKPRGFSSALAVTHIKHLLPKGVKVGHAGTLDPFATGVLLILIGQATKACQRLMDERKEYLAAFKLGATTETDDPESDETVIPVVAVPTIEQIRRGLDRLTGEIQQRPPAYSALRIDGKRAYELARKGRQVDLAARTVRIYRIDLNEYHWPFVRVHVECGRGTYIRAMARDLGESFQTGGFVTELTRTRVGPFTIDAAVPLDTIKNDGIAKHLRNIP